MFFCYWDYEWRLYCGYGVVVEVIVGDMVSSDIVYFVYWEYFIDKSLVSGSECVIVGDEDSNIFVKIFC